MTVNNGAATILKSKSTKGDKSIKSVLINIPNALYAETKHKQARMISEAAENGDTSLVSIHTVVLAALRSFVEERK
jgi:hypothetical protein